MQAHLGQLQKHTALQGGSITALAVVALLSSSGQTRADAQDQTTTKRELPAIRLTSSPVIDGDLSDPCWQQAARTDRFTDELYGNPVQDQTDVYLGYDDKNVYIAFHAHDSQPQAIIARQTKRGTPLSGD